MIHIIQPNSLNITPVIPEIIVSGKNTASIVSVDAITETATSFVAWIAACLGAAPRSICVVTFSSTTIASSTTIPIAIVKVLNDIIFNVPSVNAKYTNDAINDNGMVIPTTTVARQRPVKIYTTNTTNSKAYRIVSANDLIVLIISFDPSTITPILTSAGNVSCN